MEKFIATIVFAEPESASKALMYRVHRVSNTHFSIIATDNERQKEAFDGNKKSQSNCMLPYEKESKGGLNILHLNDDCLDEILKYLPIASLACVARTCVRVRSVATHLFATKYRSLVLGTIFNTDVYKFDDIKMVLRNFGHLINNIRISFLKFKFDECHQLIKFITKYCKSLEILQINHLCINRLVLPLLENILSTLEEVKLKNCKIYKYFDGNAMDLFVKCQSLRKFKINDTQPIEFIHAGSNTLCNLESFTYKYSGALLTTYSNLLVDIFTQCVKLKKINLNGPLKIDGTEIALIAKNCIYLEKLYIHLKFVIPFKRIENLLVLAKLQKLKIDCYGRSVSRFLNMLGSVDTLQYLELKNGRCDMQLFDSLRRFEKLQVLCLLNMKSLKTRFVDLCNMTQLTELVIRGDGFFDADIAELIDGLPKLEILTLIESNIVFNWNSYEKIRLLCQQRQQRLIIHKCDDMLDEIAHNLESSEYLEIKIHPNFENDFYM